VHDVSDGGPLVAVAEMALASGIGALIENVADMTKAACAFGEDQGRYVVSSLDPQAVLAIAEASSVPVTILGITGGVDIGVNGGATVQLDALRRAHESFFPALMEAELGA
jgi:phosphoribosylformylglycinamidine synthase